MAQTETPPLLKGRQILDCSTLLPGPFLGKLLAQKGARVLKIESPSRPDPARAIGSGAYYEDLNSCKELVALDLTRAEDLEQFHRLVRGSDGLIEGFRPKAKLKLGLDEKTLHSINPKLCIISLVGYPEDGPWRERAGHDLNFQALTGCLSLFREMPGIAFADLFSAYEGALSLVSALDAVSRGAPGRRIVVSMSETLREIQSKYVLEFERTGQLPLPGETLISGKYPCYQIYLASDGRKIAVGAIESKFWKRVCEILGQPEFSELGLATGELGEEIKRKTQLAFGAQSGSHWKTLFDSADCCVEPVLNYQDIKNGL